MLLALGGLTVLAGCLRLIDLRAVALDPYYDAAVRSMGSSWHDFLYGAFDPQGQVAIDKPPLDLWLQVLAVELLGFKPLALKLPAALGASVAVPLLYDTVRRGFGAGSQLARRAGLIAAAALAVMPVSVLTSRSDTMDSLMMGLLVAVAWLAVRAGEAYRAGAPRVGLRRLLAAALVLGLAFNVKLFEALVVLPALGLLVVLLPAGSRGNRTRGSRWTPSARAAVGCAAVFGASALAWLTFVGLTPQHDRPYPLGSSNGSVWNAVFVYNGTERIFGKTQPNGVGGPGTSAGPRSPAGPLRLFERGSVDYGGLIGLGLLPALLLGGLALWFRRRAIPWRDGRGILILALARWLASGYLLFSFAGRIHPRYLEAFTPAVAATLGAAVAGLGATRRRAELALAAVVVALFGLGLARDIQVIRTHASDEALAPAFPARLLDTISGYLRGHDGSAHYELAASAPTLLAPIVVRDARPALLLEGFDAHPLVSIAALRREARAGRVRYVLTRGSCPRPRDPKLPACSPLVRWVKAHGHDVTAALGYPREHIGLLYELG